MERPRNTAHRYDAFVSYPHEATMASLALQRGLESFAKPWYRRRALRIFRDATSMAAFPGLRSQIQAGLDQSAFLILLASPEAATSTWILEELEYWCQRHEPSRILIVLLQGAAIWDPNRHDFDWTRTTALPRTLSGVFPEEPRIVDLREAASRERFTRDDATFREALRDLGAVLHGMPKEDLESEDLRQHSRVRRITTSVSILLAALVVALSIAYRVAVTRTKEERAKRFLIEGQLIAAERPGDLDKALLLTLASLRSDPTPEARTQLQRYLRLTPTRRLTDVVSGRMWASAVAADRSVLALGTDSSVLVFDLVGARRLYHVPTAHRVRALAWGDSGRVLAAVQRSYRNGALSLFRHPGGTVLWSRDLRGEGFAVDISPSGAMVAAGTSDSSVLVYDVKTGNQIATLRQPGYVRSVRFSHDGRWLAAAGWDSLTGITLWSVSTWKPTFRARGGRNSERAVFSPDDRLLAVGSDTAIEIRAVPGGHLVRDIRHGWRVRDVQFVLGGRFLLTAGQDGTVRLWHTETWAERGRYSLDRGIRGAWPSADERLLGIGGTDGTARVLALPTLREVARTGLPSAVTLVAVGAGDSTLIAADDAGRVGGWSLSSLRIDEVIDESTTVHAVALSPDNATLAYASDDSVRIRDARTHRRMAAFGFRGSTSENGTLLAFVDCGRALLAGGGPETIVWDIASGRPRERLPGRPARAIAVSAPCPGTRLVVADSSGALIVRSPNGLDEVSLALALRCLTAFAVSKDGRWLAYATSGAGTGAGARCPLSVRAPGTLAMVDLETTRELWQRPIDLTIGQLMFSPSGMRLIGLHYSDSATIWPRESGQRERTIAAVHGIQYAAWADENTFVLSSMRDSAATILSRNRSGRWQRGTLPSRPSEVRAIATSSDGSIAVGFFDGAVQVYAPGSRDRHRTVLAERTGIVRDLMFSGTGQMLAISNGTGQVSMLRLRDDDLLAEGCRRVLSGGQTPEGVPAEATSIVRRTCAQEVSGQRE